MPKAKFVKEEESLLGAKERGWKPSSGKVKMREVISRYRPFNSCILIRKMRNEDC